MKIRLQRSGIDGILALHRAAIKILSTRRYPRMRCEVIPMLVLGKRTLKKRCERSEVQAKPGPGPSALVDQGHGGEYGPYAQDQASQSDEDSVDAHGPSIAARPEIFRHQ